MILRIYCFEKMFKIPWRLSAFVFVLAEHIILRYHFPCDCKAFYDEGDLTQRHLLQCFFPFPCLVLVRTLFGSPLSEITQMEKKNYNFLIFFLLVSISVVKHFIRSGFTVCICQKWDQYYLKSTIFFFVYPNIVSLQSRLALYKSDPARIFP